MRLSYFWYDHLIRCTEEGKEIIADIERCLNEHDFDRFMYWHDLLNNLKDSDGQTTVFLPDYAIDFKAGNDVEVNILEKENFMKIVENQWECG